MLHAQAATPTHPPPEDGRERTGKTDVAFPIAKILRHLLAGGMIELVTKSLVRYQDNVVRGEASRRDVARVSSDSFVKLVGEKEREKGGRKR